jgi:hypothetical protein
MIYIEIQASHDEKRREIQESNDDSPLVSDWPAGFVFQVRRSHPRYFAGAAE